MGVGASSGVSRRDLAIAVAKNRARAELIKMLEVAVAAQQKDYAQSTATGDSNELQLVEQAVKTFAVGSPLPGGPAIPPEAREKYARIRDAVFSHTELEPLSTFSIDVDTAAYANVRRYINGGRWPPKDAVRIEELINYFDYRDPLPDEEAPFSINVELAPAPWAPSLGWFESA